MAGSSEQEDKPPRMVGFWLFVAAVTVGWVVVLWQLVVRLV